MQPQLLIKDYKAKTNVEQGSPAEDCQQGVIWYDHRRRNAWGAPYSAKLQHHAVSSSWVSNLITNKRSLARKSNKLFFGAVDGVESRPRDVGGRERKKSS